MINKIKALGLAVVAVAAMSAFAVPAAQAGSLDPGVQPASLFAVQETPHTLVIQKTGSQPGQNEFPIACQAATLEGTTTGLIVKEATATATYTGCAAFGVAAQVLMNGCKYTVTGEQGGSNPANTSWVDVTGCTSGKTIEIKTAICTLHIPAQTGLSHIVGSQLNPQQVTLNATVAGVHVQQTGAACPNGIHTGTNAKFSGNTLAVARVEAPNSQVTKHGHQYQELGQGGAQTTLAST